jgi:hypothetical protein
MDRLRGGGLADPLLADEQDAEVALRDDLDEPLDGLHRVLLEGGAMGGGSRDGAGGWRADIARRMQDDDRTTQLDHVARPDGHGLVHGDEVSSDADAVHSPEVLDARELGRADGTARQAGVPS